MLRYAAVSIALFLAVYIQPSYQQGLTNIANMSVNVGETGFFVSLATNSGDLSDAIWLKNDNQQVSAIDNKIVIVGTPAQAQLVIYNSRPSDAGKYTLSSANSGTTSAYLIVQGSIITGLTSQSVNAGTDVTLTVVLSSAVPADDVRWEYYTTGIVENSKYDINSVGSTYRLTIRNVATSDAGEYTFIYDSLTTSMFLTVTSVAVINECLNNPCSSDALCTNTVGSFICQCRTGFSGDGFACVDLNECLNNPCSDQATCTNTRGSYDCQCIQGFSGNGVSCVDVNECNTNRGGCSPFATCSNTLGSRTCTCNQGYTGDGITCNQVDNNECNTNNGGCSQYATCTNTLGSRECTCGPGFSGNGVLCSDIDECQVGNNNCHPNAFCTNTFGSFTCRCNQGFQGDGVTCTQPSGLTITTQMQNITYDPTATSITFVVELSQPVLTEGSWFVNGNPFSNSSEAISYFSPRFRYLTIFSPTQADSGQYTFQVLGVTSTGYYIAPSSNLCDTNNGGCSSNAACINTVGSRTCTCNTGYSGNGITCTDTNECFTNNGGCSPNAACINTIGSRTCICNNGFSGDGVSCTDVNECFTNNGGCDQFATCRNTLGSRECTCNAGYSGNGFSCTLIDTNECLINNGGCSQNAACINTVGSRTCICNNGFSGDGVSCADVNECFTNNGGCDQFATCRNTLGSRECTCNAGYSGNGFSCTLIDTNECLTNNGGCSQNAACINTVGSRTCICNNGFSGDGVSCTDVNECFTNNGGCDQFATCRNTLGSRECTCNAGYSGNGFSCTLIDINECSTNNGGCSSFATCLNTVGSRTCTCNFGYTGNGITCTPTTADLCSSALNTNGVGYRIHPTDCDKYIQCYPNQDGSVVGVYRSCPFGYFWDQSTLRCSESWKVTCANERCSGKCAPHYRMSGSCRAYWECKNGVAEGRCCMSGMMYVEGFGCRPSFFCRDTCPTACVDKDACVKRPTFDGDITTYNISVGLFGWMPSRCLSGNYFDVADCGCKTLNPSCRPTYDLTFDSNGNVAQATSTWLSDFSNVGVSGGVGIFNETSTFYSNIQRADPSPFQKLIIHFKYKETVAVSGRRILFSSSDCKNDNAFVVAVDDQNISFELKSYYDNIVKLNISTAGFSRYEWTTVSFMYDGHEMVASVNHNTAKYYARVYAPDSNILECGMRFGYDQKRSTPAFVGELDRLAIYNCDPGNFL